MSSKLNDAIAKRSLKLVAHEDCAIEFLGGTIMPIVLTKGEQIDFFAVCDAAHEDIFNSTLVSLYRAGKLGIVS